VLILAVGQIAMEREKRKRKRKNETLVERRYGVGHPVLDSCTRRPPLSALTPQVNTRFAHFIITTPIMR